MSEIQDIKAKYGQQAESIIADGLNLHRNGKRYRCPNNMAHKHGDKNPSMSWDPKALQFHCFTCGMNIDIYGYYRDHLNYSHQEIIRELLGETEHTQTSIYKNRMTFQDELKKITPITQECIDYIKRRGLLEETISQFQLMSYQGEIAFPYFRYETIVGYKRRKPVKDPGKPKMLSLTGSKPYLFNAQNVSETDELIICEGEFDCMCIYQCGYKNVVSVGAGANSLSMMVEQAKDFLNGFKYMIIVSDNDEAGSNMDKFFVDTFGDKVKLVDKNLYRKKDINEELVVNGPEAVKRLIESARFKIEGRRDLDEQPYKGLTTRSGKYIPTGIPSIDNALNDLAPGCVTLIVGRANSGKTTLTRQIIANAINQENRVYVISGEGDQEVFINSVYQCVIGRNTEYYTTTKVNKRFHKEPTSPVLKALQTWHKGKLTIFNKGESKLKTTDDLFNMIEYEIKIKRHELIVIDNLMSVLSAKAIEKNEAQADFMQRCCDISKIFGIHIILVLHPNKTYSKGDRLDFEQISGTSDLGNKADNIISVIREYESEKKSLGIDGYIEVIKNRYYPDLVFCKVHFDLETGLLLEIQDNSMISYNFNWFKYLDHPKFPTDEGDDTPW
jgi:twinkle protein